MYGTNPMILPGLNEINAGIFEGMQQISPGGILYLVGPLAWTFGFPLAPMWRHSPPTLTGCFSAASSAVDGNDL